MSNWDILKKAISDVIKTNGNQEITGASLQSVLLNIVANTGANATFAGIATPTINPGAPDGPVFYLASKAGIYSNFDGIEIQFGEFSILKWETTWKKIRINPFIESSIYADYIQEIYIRGNTEDVGITTLVADNSEIQIALKTKTSIVAYLSEHNGVELGKVYHIPEYDYSGIDAYIVIGKKVKNSSDTVFFNDAAYNIACSPKILAYILNALNVDNKKTNKNWTSNSEFNLYIEELYIPNLTTEYGDDCSVYRVKSMSTETSLFLKTKSGAFFVIDYKDTTEFYYKSSAIMPLYDNTNAHLIGWAKIAYLGSDYSVDGYGKINTSLVEDINNSPCIKKMLQAPEQLILMGDSILGQPAKNPMPDILRGITGDKVWNIACGGCTMALRNMSYYDDFSFTSLIDSLVSKNFTSQEAAISNRGSEPDFSVQLQNCKQIDLSLPTVIVCNYINNDLTTNVPIGTLWEYTNTIDSYNKNTFCGAQNYGVQKLLAAYPYIKIIFITDSYRWRPQAGSGVSVPPYLYHNKNNDTAEKYVQAEKDNCKRLGIKCYDFGNYGVRNAFAMDYSTTDGTHCNAYGFQELAKYIHNIYKNTK